MTLAAWFAANMNAIRKEVWRKHLRNAPGYDHDDLVADVCARITSDYRHTGELPANARSRIRQYVSEALRTHLDPSHVGLSGFNPSRVVQYAKAHAQGIPHAIATQANGDDEAKFNLFAPRLVERFADVDEASPSPEELATQKRLLDHARTVLEAMPDPNRTRAIMHFFEHLTLDEIAERQSVSRPAVSRSIFEAVETLRVAMGT